MLIIIVVILITILSLILIIGRIVRPLNYITSFSKKLGEGDLTFELPKSIYSSCVEISQLAKTQEITRNNIKSIIDNVKRSALINREIGESISMQVTMASDMLTVITENIKSIKELFTVQETNITNSASSVQEVLGSLNNLTLQVANQSAATVETSTSITFMVSSLDDIVEIIDKKKVITNNLSDITNIGEMKVNETNSIISEVSKATDQILNMITVINKIASQTNLLAMNAAIEAAHAGESGKGFAVVAEEIRKLAESTASNVKNISSTLKNIVEQINKATNVSKESGKAFTDITKGANDVSTALNDVSVNMLEINTGNNELLKSMNMLNNISEETKVASIEMINGTKKVSQLLMDTRKISDETLNSVDNISITITEKVQKLLNPLFELQRDFEKNTNELNAELNKFKTNIADDIKGIAINKE